MIFFTFEPKEVRNTLISADGFHAWAQDMETIARFGFIHTMLLSDKKNDSCKFTDIMFGQSLEYVYANIIYDLY